MTKTEFNLALDSFKRFHLSIRDTVSDASSTDKRREWKKLEDEFQDLRGQLTTLAGIGHQQDTREFQNNFVKDAEEPFLVLQKLFLKELKETPEPVILTNPSKPSTKQEEVKLPTFKGEDKNCFLKYPIWRKQWIDLIQPYEENCRATMLSTRLDEAAQNQIIGYETDYVKAMSRLDNYYGDRGKVISCVMKEVNAQSVVVDGDYKPLLSYSVILENNYTRLTNLSEPSEHEMSNTTTMSSILQKLPRSAEEKWNEYLSQQTPSVKARPFPELVVWMASQREMWERMSMTQTVKKGSAAGKCMYVESCQQEQSAKKQCFQCGEEGHIRKFCKKKKKPKKEEQEEGQRSKPKVKKHWCAFHKGDPNRLCKSLTCQD